MLTRDDFLIRDDVIFFNHGSFGACPKPVFSEYQRWQLELERQPIEFLLRCRESLMGSAIDCIADYLNAPPDEVVFVTNATAGLNIVLRSLPLQPGDEILTTNHEYGAINRLLEFVARKTGARIVRSHVRLPYQDDATFIEDFFNCATDRTKAIVISHITSPTALIFPVSQICERARDMGIICPSLMAPTCPASCRLTWMRSAPICTAETSTSGFARPRDLLSCTCAPSTTPGSIP